MGLIGRIDFVNTQDVSTGVNSEDTYADVYIALIDATTGQQTNGNNVTANYIIIDTDSSGNDTISKQHIDIPGQSALIYSGIIKQTGINEDGQIGVIYSKSFTVSSVSGEEDSSPPVNICDLRINYITVDQPESAPGANDAQITANAASSYLPVRYSIDNVTFQSSGTFTGLSGGLKTIYVTDSNSIGCAVNQQVTIPVLANLLISDPSVTMGSNTSRWSAAFNPIVFTYQRKDFDISAITSDSLTSNAALTINADLTRVVTGDLVYVSTPIYNGVFSVTAITPGSLIINTPYISSSTGFININRLRPYYQLQTKITYQDKILGRQNTIISTNRPDSTGLIKADISNFLQSVLRAKDESNFTQVNFRDDNLSASYQIAYAQHWDDGTAEGYTSGWTTITSPYYVVYAAKQLGDQYGGNLAAYVPFKHVTGGAQLAKWVTDFSEPVYSIGYPFDLGFIYGEDLAGLNLYAVVTLLDINKNPIGGLSQINLLNEDGSFLLNQDDSKLIIQRSATGDLSVIEHIGLNRLLIDQVFADTVYYFLIDLRYKDGGEPSTFNYSSTQSADPYVDGNLQIKDNGVVKENIVVIGSGTFNMPAGDAFSVEAYTVDTSTATNPKLTLTVLKNGITVFAQTTPAIPGASLVYASTVDAGAVYDVTAIAVDGADDVTPVNITDTTTITTTEVQVMQDQLVRVDKSLDYNSIYLRWIGLTGSWNYYRFIYNQEISLDVQNATIIKNYVFDWENQDSIEEVIGKSAGQKIKVMAEDLSVADIKGLQSIKYSPKVQMLVNKNPVKWQTIVLNTATFSEYETLNGQAPFSVTFNLPSINIQSQ